MLQIARRAWSIACRVCNIVPAITSLAGKLAAFPRRHDCISVYHCSSLVVSAECRMCMLPHRLLCRAPCDALFSNSVRMSWRTFVDDISTGDFQPVTQYGRPARARQTQTPSTRSSESRLAASDTRTSVDHTSTTAQTPRARFRRGAAGRARADSVAEYLDPTSTAKPAAEGTPNASFSNAARASFTIPAHPIPTTFSSERVSARPAPLY
ncbi:hypothetical protein DFH11DRAFT_900105 [Phellopilus nigrolimitatus]|nr:hypothetical protein DFH11DRAFT_900105 [Phellopilus nigrolimitatus]